MGEWVHNGEDWMLDEFCYQDGGGPVTPEEIEALMRGAQPEDEVVIRPFVAAYESECECGVEILAGEDAGYIGDETVASCWKCCQKAKG